MKFLCTLSIALFTIVFLSGIEKMSAQTTTNKEATPERTPTQIVRGHVSDAESNAPLPGVMVAIQLDSSKRIGGTTDKNGNFRIKNVPLGRRTLKVSGIGYQEQVINELMVSAGKETVIDIALVERVTKVNEVVVTFDRAAGKINTVNEYATVSSRPFNIEDTKKYAGALGDPSRMAQNFAGVTGANDSRNDIVVRGNSPSGMLWQLEGLNIPNPNHFGALNSTGGPVSILNNNTLDKSDFFSGAFPSQYGNATAGVFDLHMRNGNSDKHEFLGQVGFNGFELGAEGPISTEAASSYLVHYRYSTLGVFKALGISFGTGGATPNYQDINLKFNFPLSKDSRITVFGLGGLSDIDFLGNEQDTTDNNLYSNENQNTRVRYKTGVGGVSYESNLSEQTFLKLTLGTSGTHEQFFGDSIDVHTRIAYPNGEARFVTQKYSAVAQLRHKFDSRNSLSAGFTADRTQFHLLNKDMNNGVESIQVNIEDGATLLQGYTQWKHRFSEEFSSIVGVHAQRYSLGSAVAVEPRASVQYIVGDGQLLSLGYGLHSQAQNIYDYFVESRGVSNAIERTNLSMGFSRSHHLVLGYDWSFAENWRIKAEAYYQSLYDIPVSQSKPTFSLINTGNSFAPTDETHLVNEGTARNYGVELTLERFFNNGFYLLATGSFFDSKYKGIDGVERNTAFNMGYVANVLAGKEFNIGNDVLSFSLRLSTTGGRYLTPLDKAASESAGNAVYDNARAYSERQTPYFRADVKLGYKIELGSSTMEFSIDLQNVSNHKNIFQQAYNRRTNSITTEYQQGFFPVPTFRYTF